MSIQNYSQEDLIALGEIFPEYSVNDLDKFSLQEWSCEKNQLNVSEQFIEFEEEPIIPTDFLSKAINLGTQLGLIDDELKK